MAIFLIIVMILLFLGGILSSDSCLEAVGGSCGCIIGSIILLFILILVLG